MRAHSARVLDPQERVAEILFGVIMALSFTGTIQVSTAGADEVRPVLAAALGCNVAWGIIDGVMYVVQQLVDRGRRQHHIARFAAAEGEDARRAILAEENALPVVDVLSSEDIAKLHARAREVPQSRARIEARDLAGALGVFLLVVIATFPVVVPYLVFADLEVAKRTSNAISIVSLFLCGWALGRYAGGRPLRLGLAMVGVGIVLVGVTLALGG